MALSNLIIPLIIAGILVFALTRQVNIFNEFLSGAKEGFMTSVNILPALVALITCVGMFKASGALDILNYALSPLAGLLRLPREVIPLALLRPISGSGAMVIFNDILGNFGPDSYIGRVASVMQGSSETTFYTIAVYFGATKVSNTRYTVGASLTADIVSFIISAVMVRLLFGM